MTAILLVALLTLLGSFLCSLFEAALYSITPSQIELLLSKGRRGAARLAALKADVDEPIAAILTVNTITHTLGSMACGAMVGREFGSEIVGLFAALFTLAVLLLTEIIPKSLGVRHAVVLGPLIAWPLQAMIWSVWPIVKASSWLMARMSGAEKTLAPTEDEVMAMSRLAARGGQLRPQESKWVENVLRLDTVKAVDLMTPRPVVEMLPADMTLGELRTLGRPWKHSRIPVTEGQDKDRIVGIVYRREVLEAMVAGKDHLKLADLSVPVDFVPEAMPGHVLLDKFLEEKKHMVAVVDEYGGFEGVVTLEDVLEWLIGQEIVDEHDEIEDMQEYARRRARLTQRLRARTGRRRT